MHRHPQAGEKQHPACDHHRGRMTDPPAEAEPERRAEQRPAGHERGDRHHVIHLQGMEEAQQGGGEQGEQRPGQDGSYGLEDRRWTLNREINAPVFV